MRSWMTVGLTLLLALLAPAAAHASNVRTDASHVYFEAGTNDTVNMAVNSGNDPDFGNARGIFFIPITGHVHPTTTDPGNCIVSTTTTSKCRAFGGEVDVTGGSQDDFVNVLAAGSVLVFEGGGGNDRAFTNTTRLTAHGGPGNDDFSGGTGFDTLDGGPGDDKLTPFGGNGDEVWGGTGFDTARMQHSGVVVTLDDTNNDGASGDNYNIHSDIERVVGGNGADTLDGNAAANTLDGGEGADTINGLGGADTLIGGLGDDTIRARDGVADQVSCGPGTDTVMADPADAVAPDCETIAYADADGDGIDARSDCNDANPAIRPGATDVPDNGVDEDCSGADATTTRKQDPGTKPDPITQPQPPAPPAPGAAAPAAAPARLQASLVHRWYLASAWSRVVQMTISGAPAGAKVTIRCSGRGCPFKAKTVSTRGGGAQLAKLFKKRKLATRTVVDVAITAPGTIGKVVRFTIKGGKKLPQQLQLCQPQGATSPQPCG